MLVVASLSQFYVFLSLSQALATCTCTKRILNAQLSESSGKPWLTWYRAVFLPPPPPSLRAAASQLLVLSSATIDIRGKGGAPVEKGPVECDLHGWWQVAGASRVIVAHLMSIVDAHVSVSAALPFPSFSNMHRLLHSRCFTSLSSLFILIAQRPLSHHVVSSAAISL
jgi:hypothetical protein